MKRKLKDHRPIDFNMLQDSARTGYVDLILAILGMASLFFNLEVALVLLSVALFEYLANRIYLLQRIFSGQPADTPVPRRRKTSKNP